MIMVRRHGVIFAAVLGGLTLSLATAHAIDPDWSRDVGLDVWNLPALEKEFEQVREEREEVLAHEENSAKRRAAAHQIVTRLADGMSLATAVDELVELYQNDRGTQLAMESMHPTAPTFRHRVARFAIDRINRVVEDPKRYAVIRARLEREYTRLDASPESPHMR